MKKPFLLYTFIFLSMTKVSFGGELQFELGAFWQIRNDVKISPQNGTLLSFDEYGRGPYFHQRFSLHYDLAENHTLRLIYAPLSLNATSNSKESFIFNGQSFSANTPTTVDFRFNSYRLGYAYRIFGSQENYFKLGLTLKIRDAEIRFTQNSLTSSYDNVGVVPLFYYALQFRLNESWSFFSDADFASAPQGRALDLSLKFRRKLSNSSSLGVGIRGLEGGAENEKVYNFSFITYAIMDLTFSW